MDSNTLYIVAGTIIASIIGGIIGGWSALRSTQQSFEQNLKIAEVNEKKIIKGVLQSIHDEIETIMDSYQTNMGSRLESLDKNEGLTHYYPLVSDFFTIYNGNSFIIGRIEDNDLRKQIIKTYILAKGMIDSFRMNNDLVSKWEFAAKIYSETQTDVHEKHASVHYNNLVIYAETLKESHKTLKKETSDLLRVLIKNGVLNEKK